MPNCAAIGCTNRSNRDRVKGITFHMFPKEEIRRQQWIQAVGRTNYTPSRRASLCSKHFKEEDMDRTSLCLVRLKEGVVPSVFDASRSYLKTGRGCRKAHKKQRASASTHREENVAPAPRTSPEHLSSLSPEPSEQLRLSPSPELPSPRPVQNPYQFVSPQKKNLKLKRKVQKTLYKLTQSKKKIKMLQRCLLKRESKLTSIIESLLRQNIPSTDIISVLETSDSCINDL